MFQPQGMLLLIGGFVLVTAVITLFYQLSTGKVWGRVATIVTRESEPFYYWRTIAGGIVGLIFITFWLSNVSGLTGMWLNSETQPSDPGASPFEETYIQSNGCLVTEDATYGYAETNPIKIGGGWFAGGDRIRLYWDNLLTAEGQPINYRPVEWQQASGIVVYDITNSTGREVARLYVDVGQWEVVRIPVGFTCSEPIIIPPPK